MIDLSDWQHGLTQMLSADSIEQRRNILTIFQTDAADYPDLQRATAWQRFIAAMSRYAETGQGADTLTPAFTQVAIDCGAWVGARDADVAHRIKAVKQASAAAKRPRPGARKVSDAILTAAIQSTYHEGFNPNDRPRGYLEAIAKALLDDYGIDVSIPTVKTAVDRLAQK
jgi:hypothetical protein